MQGSDAGAATFLRGSLTEDLSTVARAAIDHPLWLGLHDGRTTLGHLRQLALQDAWLIREIHRLDGLAIARAPSPEAADVLWAKLGPKSGAMDALLAFARGVGLTDEEVAAARPLPGCTALTTSFYYHLARSPWVEAVAALSASEVVFQEICRRAVAPLRELGLADDALTFFTGHEALGPSEDATEAVLAALVTAETAPGVTEAVRLTWGCEVLFYDTVLAHPHSERT